MLWILKLYSESILPTGPVESTFENRRMQELQTLKSQVGSLPHDKPYTAVAQEYASIYLDQLMYGDICHRSPFRCSTATGRLCEPPVARRHWVLARNMLAGLGDTKPIIMMMTYVLYSWKNRKRTESIRCLCSCSKSTTDVR